MCDHLHLSPHLQVCVYRIVNLLRQHTSFQYMNITPFFLGTGDVWFSLRNRTYQNNSIVTLEDIGEQDDALLCKTNLTACCRSSNTSDSHALGNWFFPNGTRVPSRNVSGWGLDIYRTRGQMVVLLHRRRGGEEGIYCCEIPDAMNVTQTIYIGVYSASTGEWMYTAVLFDLSHTSHILEPSHCSVFDYSMQNKGERPGSIYHMNDVKVYLGRQRGGGVPLTEIACFAYIFIIMNKE